MKRFTRPFRQLRWKLTLSYTLTSVVGFALLVGLILGGVLLWLGTHVSDIILTQLNRQASQVTPYFANASSDPEPLKTWLQITEAGDISQDQDPFHYTPLFLAATDLQGQVLASAGTHPLARGTHLQAALTPQNAAQLMTVLNDAQGTTSTVNQDSPNTLAVIAPIMDGHGHVEGALAMKIPQFNPWIISTWFFTLVIGGSLLVAIFTAIIGTVFGYLSARGLTRRLDRLSGAANRWSRGDFSAQAEDSSQDELGQMTRQLNHMAEELRNLLETRQQLATLEERNRLARDLHDSVKQQVFAVSMQLAATRVLLRRDVDAAEARLNKAEKLVQQAQQELTSLIRELRPLALDGKGLVAALRELIPQWSQQTDIVANLRVEGSQTLPLTVEEALFRVAQEALSNIARHSKATLVQLTLTTSEEMVTLSIQDNGQGFDLDHLEHRGVGLFSMQERIKALGGELRLESSPGQGTLIVAHCTRLGVDKSERAGIHEATAS